MLPEDKGFVEHVIKRVKDEFDITLPEEGTFAGQALAQMYFDYFEYDIQTRIKDIDLFFDNKHAKKSSFIKKHTDPSFLYKNFSIPKNKALYNKYKKIYFSNTNTSYDSVDMLEQEKYTIKSDFIQTQYLSMTVINTCISKENEFLNITLYKSPKNNNFTHDLISLFDFNSVQIGICLKDKKLYLTDNFKDFLRTKYVSINLSCFKTSTIIRYFDKYGYYKNCIFNPEQELKSIYFFEFHKEIKHRDFHKKTFIRDRLEKLNQKSLSAIKKYLTLQESGFYLKEGWFNFKTTNINKLSHELNNSNSTVIANDFFVSSLKRLRYSEFLKIQPHLDHNNHPFLHLWIGEKSSCIDLDVLFDPYKYKNSINKFLNFMNIDITLSEMNEKEVFILFQDILKILENFRNSNISINILSSKFIKNKEEFINKLNKSSCAFNHISLKSEKSMSFKGYISNTFIPTYKLKIKNKKYLTEFKRKIAPFIDISDIKQHQISTNYHSQLIQIFDSEKKINKIKSFLKNNHYDNKFTNSEIFIFSLIHSIKELNDYSILNLKKDLFNSLMRHKNAFKKFIINSEHLIDRFNFLNMKEYLESISKIFRTLEKTDKAYIIGLVESNKIPLYMIFDDHDIIMDKLKNTPFFNSTKHIVNDTLLSNENNNDIIIRQLRTRIDLFIEGDEMKHCIGGGSLFGQIHFSLINKAKKERTTFTFLFNLNEMTYSLQEYKNKFNELPSEENLKIIRNFLKSINSDKDFIRKTYLLLNKNPRKSIDVDFECA